MDSLLHLRYNIAMSASPPVLELLARFNQHRETYAAGQYNETQLRREFLDPFFKSLGWDMDNSAGYAEPYKDVIHEDAIRIAGAVKAPDYCFRIGGTRKFFLEAKKPSVSIKDEISAAYQLRRYAWSAKLPLSILSDFEEFAVYDCRIKPVKTDPASTARVFYCTCDEYPERFDWIASIFSRDAVLKGSFDKFAETNKAKRGTADVDDDFLATIESWRSELARSLALRNAGLSTRELNFAVQRIIDRIVFLRICEDRGIEDYGRMLALTNGNRLYPRLCELFVKADARYNSGLFCFKKEKGRIEQPDELTHSLEVDDDVLRAMLKAVYYPDSPYAFSVISSDILGQVYEQFLGKVIRLTDGHRAKVEDKPEVKKAGGVYYTPTYIVDYIVKQTVGRLVEGKTPREVATIHVLDPACGSGSFLIGAYQFLLDWHLNWYTANEPVKWAKGSKPALVQVKGGWKLTIAERKRILLNSIYGVDIDQQAVEVTKLSLLLKVLEGESEQSVQQVFDLFHERALPDLGSNIKCGNSLIGPDFYQQPNLPALSDDDRMRINVFDWNAAFPQILGQKDSGQGFDAVIGNPPYDVMEKERGNASWPHEALAMYAKCIPKLCAALGGKGNLFRFFVVKCIELVKEHGRTGLIVPLALLADASCAPTRKHLILNTTDLVLECFPQKDNASRRVFRNAKLSTTVFTATRTMATMRSDASVSIHVYPWNSFNDKPRSAIIEMADAAKLDPVTTPIPLVSEREWELCKKTHNQHNVSRFGELSEFTVSRGEINQTIYREFITSDPGNARLLKGAEVGRYNIRTTLKQGVREWFKENAYLSCNKPKRFVCYRRIATQRITGLDERLRVVASIVDPPTYFADSTNSIVVSQDSRYGLEYILAILNSRLIQWRFKLTSSNNNVATNEIESLPFRRIDFSASDDSSMHHVVVKSVERMMSLQHQLRSAKTPHEKEALEGQIAATDRLIDKLVYELYNLSEEDIALVTTAQTNME